MTINYCFLEELKTKGRIFPGDLRLKVVHCLSDWEWTVKNCKHYYICR